MMKLSFRNNFKKFFYQRKRGWRIAFIVFVLIIVFFSVRYFFKDSLSNYEVEEVSRGKVLQTISETANLKPTEKIQLSFRVSGKVAKVNIKAGDEVSVGDILVALDTSQIDSQIASARAQVEVAENQYLKLLKGSREEELKIYQDAVRIAQQQLNEAYQSGFTALNDAYIKIYNSYNLLKYIQEKYFNRVEPETVEIWEAVNTLKDNLDQISILINQAKNNFSDKKFDEALSKTSSSLEETLSSLKKTRDICDYWKYSDAISTTDKGSLETQLVYINNSLISLTSTRENIKSLKLSLEKAQNNLSLQEAKPREEDVDIYSSYLEQAKALLKQYESQYKDYQLISPINGKVLAVDVKEGESVSPGKVVIELITLNPFQLKADIYEEDVVKLKIGDPVEIVFIAFPKKILEGKIVAIDSKEKIINDVVYYEITIDFPNEIEGLRSGMTADILIYTQKKENVLRLPCQAIEKLNGKEVVEVVKGKTILKKEVQIGLEGNDYCEILSGLQEGDKVIVSRK